MVEKDHQSNRSKREVDFPGVVFGKVFHRNKRTVLVHLN